MEALDWAIVTVYLVALLALSRHLSKRQYDAEDYYLGGRGLRWWTVGISTMATQLSAVSFVSAPAFVALKPGGGMRWLGYEFAVPLAVIFIMKYMLPVYHRARVVSIYEYLEKRFGGGTRTLISAVFQISRSMAAGVMVYAVSLVLSASVGLPLTATILLTGVVTLVYDTWGGMKAVIYSDVIQMLILVVGIALCGFAALAVVGGVEGVVGALDAERFRAVDFAAHGLGDGKDFGFWPLLIGGFFLYVSYYGCDQSQMQRELSVGHVEEGRKSLMFNGLVRFPIVLGYCLMGLAVGAVVMRNPGLEAAIAQKGSLDYMVPLFILRYMPAGLKGLLVVAILAAAMSSLDSALNSLSAATMRDILQPWLEKDFRGKRHLAWSKALTVFWGGVCVGFAFLTGRISGTVIEVINKIGSVFYGPILGVFLLGMMTGKTTGLGACLGVLAGVCVNVTLWVGCREVSWLWWNVAGFLATLGIGYVVSLPRPTSSARVASLAADGLFAGEPERARCEESRRTPGIRWAPMYGILVVYCCLIVWLAARMG